MDFKQVQTFVALSKFLHFGQTAEHLRIAQPHVSRRIKQLEEELDVLLFYRDKRNVKLTEAGTVFLQEAQALLKSIELAKVHTKESALGRRGKLNVTLVGSAMLGKLPKILMNFRNRYPDVHLAFTEMGSVAQLEALSQHTTDIAFFHPPMRATGTYDQILLEKEPLIAVLPENHPLARRRKLDLIELASDPWVMFPRDDNSPIYDRIIATCNDVGFSPKVVQEAGPVTTRLGLVASGFGVHLVGRAWQSNPYPGIVYIPIHPTTLLGLSCYWRQGDPNIILKLFVETLSAYQI